MEKNINSKRVFVLNQKDVNPDGDFVLYWMHTFHRIQYNFALEYAVAWANKLQKPLLIVETVALNHPWASKRRHRFLLQGQKEMHQQIKDRGVSSVLVVEDDDNQRFSTLEKLSKNACMLITDFFPILGWKSDLDTAKEWWPSALRAIDSNGILPLRLTEKDPYNAFFFRKIMQKHFREAYDFNPKKEPLAQLEKSLLNQDLSTFTNGICNKIEGTKNASQMAAELSFKIKVPFVDKHGSREAALEQLDHFIQHTLAKYADKRSDPDEDAQSGLSPYLHFGKISSYEIVKAVFDSVDGYSLDQLNKPTGKNRGFFNLGPNEESFLDELITWREVGYHFCFHRPDFDKYNSLPDWSRTTMDEHKNDSRDPVYTFDQLHDALTYDEVWNAAQIQLREDGIIHNYLRMLWGKKVIEWSKDYETALTNLIELNNRYSIDGCDPNSYSGIFWCFGRFDRAWQERDIFGKLRYMTSESAKKKIKMKAYLRKFSNSKDLFT